MAEANKPTFNIALGYTQFLLYSLSLCSEHSRNRDFDNWFFELYNLYRWVSTHMKGDFDQIKTGKLNNDNEDNFAVMEKLLKEGVSLLSKFMRNPSVSKDLYIKLHTIEMYLRKIIKDSGLEMKDGADPRYSLMEQP